MTVINTNVASLIASNSLAKNGRDMGQAMQRLSTGKRINSAYDDAAGLAISSKLTSQVQGLGQAIRNANNAISMIQTADGATKEIANMLQRMRVISVQYANGTVTSADQANINLEFKELALEIDRIANNTQWNGRNLLDGTLNTDGDVSFQIGANANQTIDIKLADFNLAAGAVAYNDGVSANGAYDTSAVNGEDLSGMKTGGIHAGTTGILTKLDTAISGVNTERAKFGASLNRLDFASDNLINVQQNTIASRSRIMDTDYAAESAEIARTLIIQRAASAMLAQANVTPALVASLLN